MGIEPILPRKRDFESRASTNSATPAHSLGERAKFSFFTRGCQARHAMELTKIPRP